MAKAVRISPEAADQLTELRKLIAGEGNPMPTISATVGMAIETYLKAKRIAAKGVTPVLHV